VYHRFSHLELNIIYPAADYFVTVSNGIAVNLFLKVVAGPFILFPNNFTICFNTI
jgi:hypothetical protein